ncbi:MAG: hypothetical protein AB7V48_00985 [Sedimentibacter sp.]
MNRKEKREILEGKNFFATYLIIKEILPWDVIKGKYKIKFFEM